jgi:hypothetical protein
MKIAANAFVPAIRIAATPVGTASVQVRVLTAFAVRRIPTAAAPQSARSASDPAIALNPLEQSPPGRKGQGAFLFPLFNPSQHDNPMVRLVMMQTRSLHRLKICSERKAGTAGKHEEPMIADRVPARVAVID